LLSVIADGTTKWLLLQIFLEEIFRDRRFLGTGYKKYRRFLGTGYKKYIKNPLSGTSVPKARASSHTTYE
jgi:hypothetical protein